MAKTKGQNTNKKPNAKQSENKKRTALVALLILLLLLLLLWWAAARNNWWPFNGDDSKTPGTSSQEASGSDSGGTSDTGSSSGSGGTSTGSQGATGNTGATGPQGPAGNPGSNGNGGNNGGGTNPPAQSSIVDFSADIGNGNTKAQVNAKSNGLPQTCTVTTNTVAAGKTEVCIFTEGSRVVTVTFLNDRVVDVTRSGF